MPLSTKLQKLLLILILLFYLSISSHANIYSVYVYSIYTANITAYISATFMHITHVCSIHTAHVHTCTCYTCYNVCCMRAAYTIHPYCMHAAYTKIGSHAIQVYEEMCAVCVQLFTCSMYAVHKLHVCCTHKTTAHVLHTCIQMRVISCACMWHACGDEPIFVYAAHMQYGCIVCAARVQHICTECAARKQIYVQHTSNISVRVCIDSTILTYIYIYMDTYSDHLTLLALRMWGNYVAFKPLHLLLAFILFHHFHDLHCTIHKSA